MQGLGMNVHDSKVNLTMCIMYGLNTFLYWVNNFIAIFGVIHWTLAVYIVIFSHQPSIYRKKNILEHTYIGISMDPGHSVFLMPKLLINLAIQLVFPFFSFSIHHTFSENLSILLRTWYSLSPSPSLNLWYNQILVFLNQIVWKPLLIFISSFFW